MSYDVNFKHITSRDNPIFKQLKRLSENSRDRKQDGKTLLDGVHLIESYLQAFGDANLSGLELIVIPEGKSSLEATNLIQNLQDVRTVMFPTLMFADLTPVSNSTGILALVKTPLMLPPKSPSFILFLEDIQDPGNLGAILRTALGANVEVVYCSKGCTDAWSPKCLRGGQGAQFFLPIIENADIVEEIKKFSGNVYATTLNGESLFAQDLVKSTAFVIGNEGSGLSKSVIEVAFKSISIPMSPKLESLNAAAAAAICLFERRRQIG